MNALMEASVEEEHLSRIEALARKAIKKSGGKFFVMLQKHVKEYVTTLLAAGLDANDLEAAQDLCTSDNLILLARHYAGEIASSSKRKRAGAPPTNADKVKALLNNTPVRLVLDVVVLASHIQAAENECDHREANAEQSEHWAREHADVDPADMWATRNKAIVTIKSSWDAAAEAAKAGDWEALESVMDELVEIDA